MKRDMELVRTILLRVEEKGDPLDSEQIDIEGVDEFTVSYHVELLHQAGLITAWEHPAIGRYQWDPIALTWQGHDFLDSVRDPEVWAKTKAGAQAVKSWSFDTLKEIGKGLIKKQIEEFTGVKVG